MPSRAQDVRPPERRRRILAAALALVALFGWCGRVPASSLSPGTGIDAEAPEHLCGCRTRCRGNSCCCGHRKQAPARLAPRPSEAPADPEVGDGAGPCMNAAPCGESGLPSSPAGGPVDRSAALAIRELPGTSPSRRLAIAPSCDPLPDRRASRLDEPPEGPLPA